MILRKPISVAPRRLQDIMTKINRYDVTFKFVKGEGFVISDAFSRATVVIHDELPGI